MRINSRSCRCGSPLGLPLLHHFNDVLSRRKLLRLGRVLNKFKLSFDEEACWRRERGGVFSRGRQRGVGMSSQGVQIILAKKTLSPSVETDVGAFFIGRGTAIPKAGVEGVWGENRGIETNNNEKVSRG